MAYFSPFPSSDQGLASTEGGPPYQQRTTDQVIPQWPGCSYPLGGWKAALLSWGNTGKEPQKPEVFQSEPHFFISSLLLSPYGTFLDPEDVTAKNMKVSQ